MLNDKFDLKVLYKHIADIIVNNKVPLHSNSFIEGGLGAVLILCGNYQLEYADAVSRIVTELFNSKSNDKSHIGHLRKDIWLALVLRILLNSDIIDDSDNTLRAYIDVLLKKIAVYYRDVPIRLEYGESIYPWGFFMWPFLEAAHDDYAHVQLTEKIIMQIVECEAILTKRVRYLHDPKNFGYGMLHSIYQFASDAERQRIYTFKAHQLQQIIEKWPHKVTDKSLAHRYIFEYLTGNPVCRDFLSARPGRRVDMLAEVGLFAFIYHRPQMFEDLFDALTASDAIFYSRLSDTVATGHACPKTLIGIGLGITSCIENEKS